MPFRYKYIKYIPFNENYIKILDIISANISEKGKDYLYGVDKFPDIDYHKFAYRSNQYGLYEIIIQEKTRKETSTIFIEVHFIKHSDTDKDWYFEVKKSIIEPYKKYNIINLINTSEGLKAVHKAMLELIIQTGFKE